MGICGSTEDNVAGNNTSGTISLSKEVSDEDLKDEPLDLNDRHTADDRWTFTLARPAAVP